MRISFLRVKDDSSWTSCSAILSELESIYKKTFEEQVQFFVFDLTNEELVTEVMNKIANSKPDIIYFADHRILNIPIWVRRIKSHLSYEPHWSIQVYGCFMGRVNEWLELAKTFEKDSFSFLCASHTQKEAVAQFFTNNENIKSIKIPISNPPILDLHERQEIRKELGLKESQRAFIYSGRISYQKNVHHLVRMFHEFNKLHCASFKLFIAGSYDNITPPASPHAYYLNYSYELFSSSLAEANAESTTVCFLGQKSNSEIMRLNLAMDAAISLSTLDGDDHGRSLIEALASGLPILVSRWGGHKDFSDIPQARLLTIFKNDGSLQIDLEEFNLKMKSITFDNQLENQQWFYQHYNIAQESKSLKEFYLKSFEPLHISKKMLLHSIRLEKEWNQEEFFNYHEQVLHPYWS